MDDNYIPINWQDDSLESVEIGYLNPNGQQCCGHYGVQGTDHSNMPIKLNAQYAIMFMEQTDLTCMKDVAPSVKRERLALGTRKLLKS